MDFYIDMEDMSHAITVLGEITEEITNIAEQVDSRIAELCNLGWSGEAQEAFLLNTNEWIMSAEILFDMFQQTKENLEKNIVAIDNLLSEGQALHI